MRIGLWLFLIAAGAILKFAVTDTVKDVNLGVVGIILMVVGVVGLLVEAALYARRRHYSTTVVQRPAAPDAYTTVERY